MVKLTGTILKDTAGGENLPVRGIYVYWFVADAALTADHLQRMWWMARDLVTTGTLQRWAYVSYLTMCSPGQEAAAFERLKQLIAAAAPEFQTTAGTRVSTTPVRADSAARP